MISEWLISDFIPEKSSNSGKNSVHPRKSLKLSIDQLTSNLAFFVPRICIWIDCKFKADSNDLYIKFVLRSNKGSTKGHLRSNCSNIAKYP